MKLSLLLTGSEEGPVLLLEPGSWLLRSCSRNVFWGKASPTGSGGREVASPRFRAGLVWLPSLLLRAVVLPAPLREDQEGALHHGAGQKACQGRVREACRKATDEQLS